MDDKACQQLGLSELRLFQGICAEEVTKFIAVTGSVVKKYTKNKRVLAPYEANPNIGVMVKGKAQVIAEDCFGHESIGHTVERGALVGGISAILPDIQFVNNMGLEALTDVMVLWIPYRSIFVTASKLGRTHGMAMKNLLEIFCEENVQMMEKIEILSLRSLRERLVMYMLQQEKKQGQNRIQMPGRIQLAKELKCHRSALTREIAAMEAEGILETGEDWTQLDKEKVQQACDLAFVL